MLLFPFYEKNTRTSWKTLHIFPMSLTVQHIVSATEVCVASVVMASQFLVSALLLLPVKFVALRCPPLAQSS